MSARRAHRLRRCNAKGSFEVTGRLFETAGQDLVRRNVVNRKLFSTHTLFAARHHLARSGWSLGAGVR
jgi:hypothetical protein